MYSGQALTHDFVNYDDNAYVYSNRVVAQGLTFRGLAWAFSFHASNWHPLTWLSHMLDCQVYGLRPAGHHLTNVLLHAATVVLLFLVLRQMTAALWRSAFVAAVFAVHPLRVESVAWVAERKDVLSGLFFVLTVAAYVRHVRRPGSSARYGITLLSFALGLMCKPMLVTLPVVMLLLDYWPLQREESAVSLLIEKTPFLVLSIAASAVTILAQSATLESAGSYSMPVRVANALVSYVVYLWQMLRPAGLAVLYPLSSDGPPAWEAALAGMALAVLSVMALASEAKAPLALDRLAVVSGDVAARGGNYPGGPPSSRGSIHLSAANRDLLGHHLVGGRMERAMETPAVDAG